LPISQETICFRSKRTNSIFDFFSRYTSSFWHRHTSNFKSDLMICYFYQQREQKLYKWFFLFVFYQIGFVDPEGRVVGPFSFSFFRYFLVIPDAVPASLAAAGPLRVVPPSGIHSINMFYNCNSLPFYKPNSLPFHKRYSLPLYKRFC